MKPFSIFTYIIGIVFSFVLFSSTQAKDIMCTMEYAPVCGEIQVQCVKAPCPPIKETFANTCIAKQSWATNLREGKCPDIIPGGDNDEHGCKASAGYVWDEELLQCIRPWETDLNTILRAYQKEITIYNTSDTFMPQSYVTREQAAKMLMTMIDQSWTQEWMLKQPIGSCNWKDDASIDPTLASQVTRSCTKGLFKGSDQGYFSPHQAITREHMGFIFERLSTFIPEMRNQPILIEKNSTQAYTRIDFIHTLHDFSQIIESIHHQNFWEEIKNLEKAQEIWKSKNINNYTLIQTRLCFCPREYTRPMSYEVKNGKVVVKTVSYVDKDEIKQPPLGIELNSIDDAFALIQDAITRRVDTLTVEYDEVYGYPTKIFIDYSRMMADEELNLSFKLIP